MKMQRITSKGLLVISGSTAY